MGLMKLSGDIYDYQEDAKLAMAGVSNLDQAPVVDPLADEQLAPVNGALPSPNLPTPAPVPSAPAVKEPDEVVDPLEGPKGDNLLSPTPKSFKELPKTTLASYKGTKMSKLNAALNKLAMTEGDFQEFGEDPSMYQGTLGTQEDMENYNMPADYSNYLAANASAPQDSYDIGESDMAEIYGDYPTTDSDLQQAYTNPEEASYYPEETYSPSQDAMGYSAYGNDYMGYSPEEAYYQMYASPEAQAADYEDMQTQSIDPEAQAVVALQARQKEVYDESYNEVYNYLVQMGYSPEEAQAAVPSLLSQVNVSAPETAQPTKTASYMFKQAASDLVSEYIDAGYSPYQAQEMSIMVVVPQAEKYASQGRLIGGGVGALLGGSAGHAMYDDDGEIGGALISAAIGGGLGAAAPGRWNQYAAKRLLTGGKNTKVNEQVAQLRAAEEKIMQEANAEQVRLINEHVGNTVFAGVTPAADLAGAKALAKLHNVDVSTLIKGQAGKHYKAQQAAQALTDNPGSVKAIQQLAEAEAAAARSRDLKGAVALAIPGTMLHRYAASHGGDNFVDNTFDAADYLGDRVGDAASALRDNPEYLAAAAGGYGLMRGGSELAAHLKKRKAEGPNKKKSRTKKANMEIQAQELQKLASWAARLGGGLVGSVVGGNLADNATDLGPHRDNWWAGATGALAGGLAGAGLGQLARAGLRGATAGAGFTKQTLPDGATRAQKMMNAYKNMMASPMERGLSGGVGGAIAGGTAGGVGEMYREYQKADTDPYYDSQYLRALTRGGVLGAAAGGLGGLGLGAKRVAIMGSLYPAVLAAKGGLGRTRDALETVDWTIANPLSAESMRAIGQGFGDVTNIGQQSAQAVGLTPAQAQQKGNAAIEWAKENPYLAGAAALGTAGALYGGYRAFAGDGEQTPQQKLEALRRKRNV